MVAAWRARAVRPALASAVMSSMFLSNLCMAWSRSLRALWAFFLIWSELASMRLSVLAILAAVAAARAVMARCWAVTAILSSLALWALFLRMTSRVLEERSSLCL